MIKLKTIRLMDIQDTLVKNDPNVDLDKLHQAYVYAASMHLGQLRQSGEVYFSHPLNVAYILAEMNMDIDTIVAGLLHDTIEDTEATYEYISEKFGRDVAFLVESVTKISKIPFQSKEEKQAASFRKMLVSMSDDFRVIIIKLADRLHNMRTIQSLREDKQIRIAQETMDIYAPIAHRLGIAWLKWELEDLSFRILTPEMYYEVHQKVKFKRTEREEYLNNISEMTTGILKKAGIEADISGRPKHFYSIYSKMVKKQTTFEEIFDLLAIRVVVKDKSDCYSALGIIHSLWTPIAHRIKDYIANPKANLYQSIHTTVMGPSGMLIEFQIRTTEMHHVAEEGIAAHWRYKEGGVFDQKEDTRFLWLRKILEEDRKNGSPSDIVDRLKNDVLQKQIYVFTPNGDVIELPEDSTPIDFAYAIHSAVGNRCVGAKINNRIVSLKYILNSGDKVEILTSQNQEPRKDWLNIVITNRAKTRINSYLRKKDSEKAITTGKELLSKDFNTHNLNYETYLADEQNLKKLFDKLGLKTVDDLFISLGFGNISSKKVLHILEPDIIKNDEIHSSSPVTTDSSSPKSNPFVIDGIDNMMMKIAKCCNPLPGDDVKGYVSSGRGIIVHRSNCSNLLSLTSTSDRVIDVTWNESSQYKAPLRYHALCDDSPSMIVNLTTVIKDMSLNIYEMSVKADGNGSSEIYFTVLINNKEQSVNLTNKLLATKGVLSVETH